MKNQSWTDCDNPVLLKELIGFDDKFPYLEQTQSIPKVAQASYPDCKLVGLRISIEIAAEANKNRAETQRHRVRPNS